MLRALLLDLDDTLFDRSVAFVAWAREAARAQGGRQLDAGELARLVALDERGLRSREDFARDAARDLGLGVDPAAFPAQLARHVEPEPDVLATVMDLAAVARVAIVTNGGPSQRTKLARLGLDEVVHAVFVSSELGVAKPSEAFFAHALRWADAAPDQVAMVGDQPAIDLAPARALGMTTVWRMRGDWPAALSPPDHRIDRLSQLPAIAAGPA